MRLALLQCLLWYFSLLVTRVSHYFALSKQLQLVRAIIIVEQRIPYTLGSTRWVVYSKLSTEFCRWRTRSRPADRMCSLLGEHCFSACQIGFELDYFSVWVDNRGRRWSASLSVTVILGGPENGGSNRLSSRFLQQSDALQLKVCRLRASDCHFND